MKVLSVYDGISCGRVALDRQGLKVDKYVAYEIEDAAIRISKKNYADIEHCGDVFKGDFKAYKGYDLLLGGSPCTYWSVAKQGRETSTEGIGCKLFNEYVRALRESGCTYFLYENNSGMHPDIKAYITDKLGVEPIEINSADFSAQRRKRLYWTNIPVKPIPKESGKGVTFGDIAVYDKALEREITESMWATLKETSYGYKYDASGKGYYSQHSRIYKADGKAPTVVRTGTQGKLNMYLGDGKYKVTCPVECERLQTLPDNYTCAEGVSKTKRFECIGNSWTVAVIEYILSGLKSTKINS